MKKIERADVFHAIAKTRMLFNSETELLELMEVLNPADVNNIELELIGFVSQQYCGVSNGYLVEVYQTITGKRVEVVGNAEDLYSEKV